jgi:hypothetical protein
MSKREILALVVMLTGVLLCSTPITVPLGLLLLGGGGYLLVLPHVVDYRANIDRPRREKRQT